MLILTHVLTDVLVAHNGGKRHNDGPAVNHVTVNFVFLLRTVYVTVQLGPCKPTIRAKFIAFFTSNKTLLNQCGHVYVFI